MELFVSFAILIFYLAICDSISSGLIILLLFPKNKSYFLDIFKPGLFAGAIGLLLVFCISYSLSTTADQTSQQVWLMTIPLITMCAGNIFETTRIYRKQKIK